MRSSDFALSPTNASTTPDGSRRVPQSRGLTPRPAQGSRVRRAEQPRLPGFELLVQDVPERLA
jgi:hypothetical protein